MAVVECVSDAFSLHQEQDDVIGGGCRSLVEAIDDRYGDSNISDLVAKNSAILTIKIANSFNRTNKCSGSLDILVLNDYQITHCGDLCDMHHMVQDVSELDLDQNGLADWNEVSKILHLLPALKHCNLSHNPLHKNVSMINSLKPMQNLSSLVLNGTKMKWSAIVELLNLLPLVEELHLSLNDFSDAFCESNDENIGEENVKASTSNESTGAPCFPNVHVLHLNRCSIRGWRHFSRLVHPFTCVESLVVADNEIFTIDDTPEKIADQFGCLHTLNARNWKLSQWSELDKFRWFPLLTELKISDRSLFEGLTEEDRRKLVVARLPDVTLVNGSQVSDEHRDDSERFFIRYYIDREDRPPRYYELERIHGQLLPLAEIDFQPQLEALVTITFGQQSIMQKVSVKQSIGKFKKSLESFASLSIARFRLFYLSKQTSGFLEELKYNRLMLYSLNVKDEDEFVIQEKPLPVTRRRTTSSGCSSQSSPK